MPMATISIGFAYKLQEFWQEWNIRIFVLLSQFLQLMLYFLMPHRKITSNTHVLLLINATYVISFIAAGMALAYISSGMPDHKGYQPPLVLWASFMLLHLAGVGQTVAHTVHDSKMWYKRFFSFLFKDLVIFLVICLQWRHVAVPGGWALIAMVAYLGSFLQMKLLWLGRSDTRVKNLLRSDTMVNYLLHGKPRGDGRSRSSTVDVEIAGGPASSAPRGEKIMDAARQLPKEFDEFDLVTMAFAYYHHVRKLIPGLSFTNSERELNRSDFLKLDSQDAVRIAEIELNFVYEAYFTNGFDPPKHRRGCYLLLRLIYHSCVFALFTIIGFRISFLSLTDLEDKYKGRDRLITRVLCFSTVLLNCLTLLKFLFSDYVIANWKAKGLAKLLQKRTFIRRWSKTMSRRSFMFECLREATMRSTPLPRIFSPRYGDPPTPDTQEYDDEVGKFIFSQLQKKARLSKSKSVARVIYESKGDWVLLQPPSPHYRQNLDFLSSFLDSPYDLRLLLWHIATEMLYYRTYQQGNDPRTDQCREMSYLFSEYMMYIIFERHRIISTLRGNFIVRYHDISRYIKDAGYLEKWYKWRKAPPKEQLLKFYDMMVDDRCRTNDGGINQPVVLVEAVKIAKELKNKLKENEMWEVVGEVWVELLAYAATHCDPIAHVQRLAEGGELISIVWLLSAHLGFGDYFLPKEEEQDVGEESYTL